MWRAYDCSINGVSDAVHHTPNFDGKKTLMTQGLHAKLKWLNSQGKLPLPTHQAFGSYFTRVKRVKEGFNPIKKENVLSLRNVTECQEGVPLLELARTDNFLPTDDKL